MASWLIAFKGVLLEGLEVWLVVVAFGLHALAWASSAAGALAALLMVIAAGLVIRAPLRHVPENAIKFAVGAMITAFGTFWTLEAVGGTAAWPWGDWRLLGLAGFYALGGMGAYVIPSCALAGTRGSQRAERTPPSADARQTCRREHIALASLTAGRKSLLLQAAEEEDRRDQVK